MQNALKYLKLTTEYAGKKMFTLQSPLGKVLVHKYYKSEVGKKQLVAKV